MGGWLVIYHSRIAASPLPLARVVPSGLNATDWTAPVWSSGSPMGWWVATSHSRSVSSLALPLARVVPSGLNATDATYPAWTSGLPMGWWVATSHSLTD